MTSPSKALSGVEIVAPAHAGRERVLTAEALKFIVELQRRFNSRRVELLAARAERQKRLDAGEKPDFLPETRGIREAEWTVAAIPKDLQDRRVEITGPVDRKMIINALNSGAKVFMADFEDSNTPTWSNQIEGQDNLMDAVRRRITYSDPASGKNYKLNERTAVLLVRPRGWHLEERHILVDGTPMSGALFDFGLYFFHNAKELLASGSGPYFYLPKIESHLEARLWNDIFQHSQDALGIPRGSIRATVLIETILAAFEMDEILYELREHSAGLNCGRWDYIFSAIKKFRERPDFVLPDRARVTMECHFLASYVDLLVHTCHWRGVHAMGGMAAQIPNKHDAAANAAALAKVRQDKFREVHAGHDGTWVAHPGLVAVARAAFDAGLATSHQIARRQLPVDVGVADLLAVPDGAITHAGLRTNIDVGVQYLAAWLGGTGCVPRYNLMEDAATAEISRSQVWQWVHHSARLDDGRTVTPALVERTLAEELGRLRGALGDERFDGGHIPLAAQLFRDLTTGEQFPEFLTSVAYEYLD